MATNTVTILQQASPNEVPVTTGFFVDYAGIQDSTRTFNIAEGAGAQNLDAGATVNVEGTSDDFTYVRDGSTFQIIDNEGNVTAEILASPNTTSTVSFDDGTSEVGVDGDQITFGGKSFGNGDEIDGATANFDFEVDEATVSNITTQFNETDNNVASFKIATDNVSEGETLNLNFEGDLTDEDIEGNLPTTATVNAEGNATVELTFLPDRTTEGDETFSFSATIGDQEPVASPEVTIEDTSTEPTEVNVGVGTSNFEAAGGSFTFIDSVETSNNVAISNFGADDRIIFEGGVTAEEVSFQETGGDTQFEIDNGAGIVSRITLLGVTTNAFSVEGFNDDPNLGDVVFA